jgi:hypothetical protein
MPVPGVPPVVHYEGRAGAVLRQLVRAACPSDLDELGIADELVQFVEESMAYGPPLFARALGVGLVALDAASVLDGGGTTLSRMPIERARAYVEETKLGANVPRAVVIPQVRLLALLGYFEHPLVKARMGYDPAAWIEKVRKERLARHADDV